MIRATEADGSGPTACPREKAREGALTVLAGRLSWGGRAEVDTLESRLSTYQMTQTPTTSGQEGGGPPQIVPPPDVPLPRVVCGVSVDEAVASLEAAARRGKMPGFHRAESKHGAGVAFVVTDFGTPFESVLVARSNVVGVGCELRFETRLKPLMPWVFAIALILTVWPGVWLTDSMLKTYFTGYTWATWMWYLPLTVPFLPPAMWAAIKRSRTSARAEVLAMIETIGTALGGKVMTGTGADGGK